MLLSPGMGFPYRRKGSVVMDAIAPAFAVLHQSQPEVPVRSSHRRLRLQQVEEGQAVSSLCITVLTMHTETADRAGFILALGFREIWVPHKGESPAMGGCG